MAPTKPPSSAPLPIFRQRCKKSDKRTIIRRKTKITKAKIRMDPIQKIPNLLRTPPLPKPDPVLGAPSFERQRSWKHLVFDILAVLFAAAVGYACLLYFSGGISFPFFLALAALFLLASF